ncbi:hypothetical protein M2337_000478 [Sphingobium sp. B2D3A]|nr:hypothetical protein [Sphingobium sp. B2D3A]MCW2386000.1 hypothetical protein [Sphingobium sp. B2D3D]
MIYQSNEHFQLNAQATTIAVFASITRPLQLNFAALQHKWPPETRALRPINSGSHDMTILKKIFAAYISAAAMSVPFGGL